MKVIVDVTGGQGFLPNEVKNDPVKLEAFAQDIVDRYCSTEYFDSEAIEYYEVGSLWYRVKAWLQACPFWAK